MTFELNQQSRLFYDTDVTSMHAVNSEKPMRYRQEFSRADYFNTPLDIETSNNLRAKPTRLNEVDYPYTDLTGTAPLRLRTGPIDTETRLLHGETNHARCGKYGLEEHPFFDKHIHAPVQLLPVVVEDTVRGGNSTRNQYKNTQLLV